MKVTIRQKSGMQYLYADINVSAIRVKATLGITVKDGEFRPKSQTVKGKASSETNILISNMKTEIMELIRTLQRDGDLSKSSIKEGIVKLRESLTNPIEHSNEETYFYDYAKHHIERSKPTRKSGTLRQYGVSLRKIESYEKHKRLRLRFKDVNLDFYNSFVSYCTKDLDLCNNTIGTHIKNIKMWMNASKEDNLHTCTAHQSRSFQKIATPADTIYLNEEELHKIKTTIMPTECLDNVRDIFILACYTGVRIQDYHKLNNEHLINDGKLLKIRTEKTGIEVIIPLHTETKRILEKYNGTPRMISSAKFNEYIKDVCRIAGITELVKIGRTKGGKRIAIIKPKCDLVSSHCARRSFATNAYKAGLPTLSIMAITGHKTETVFLKYVRVSKEEHANLVSQHSFFIGKVG
ncbi:MAG: tyrosine-type recombinase/integrase [Crocinitomix sp.]|nr:tyrosine-type recombinase/integrase [Crocinitomix sp.]